MRRIFTAVVTLAVLTALPAPAAAPAAVRRRALVIGIDRYAASPRWGDLDGAANDARDMAEMLRARFGYRQDDVTVLLDGEATRDAILAAFQRVLVDPAGPGEIGVFYYAGHGSQVKNLKSPKPDKLDETIVPADGRDIRDVELGRLAEAAADKGLRLTMILDSCHSGSATRGLTPSGKVRKGEPDLDHPISDDSPRPSPDKKGVLVLAAARPEQLAGEARRDGRPHGAFTAALLETLSTSSGEASAEAVFVRSHALVKAIRPGQDPGMEGNEERRRAPLFTPPTRGGSGKPIVAVAAVRGAEVELLGGAAAGLAEGATLERQGAAKRPLRLTVKRVDGLSRSIAGVARVGDGDVATVEPGDAFEIERYGLAAPAPLRVEVGALRPLAAVLASAKALGPLRHSKAIRLVEDPTALDPTHVLSWSGGRWLLRGPAGDSRPIPGEPSAAQLEKLLAGQGLAGAKAPCDKVACLFVRLPVPAELAVGLKWEREPTAPVVATEDPVEADYVLSGRLAAAGPEYALVRSGAQASDGTCSTDFQLPVRTDWVAAGTPALASQAAFQLDDMALRIGRVNAWITFRAPQDDRKFPWRLGLTSGGQPIAGRSVPPDSQVALELIRTGDGSGSERRFPYVFAIDCKGAIDVAWPEEGRLPDRLPGEAAGSLPERIPLTTVQLDATRGRYTFLLVAADEQFPSVAAVAQGAVVRGAPVGEGAPDDVRGLLLSLGRTRGLRPAPRSWSVERVGFVAGP